MMFSTVVRKRWESSHRVSPASMVYKQVSSVEEFISLLLLVSPGVMAWERNQMGSSGSRYPAGIQIVWPIIMLLGFKPGFKALMVSTVVQ